MIKNLIDRLHNTPLAGWAKEIQPICEQRLSEDHHGNISKWQQAIDDLPDIGLQPYQVNNGQIAIGDQNTIGKKIGQQIEDQLRQLLPWRKGPYSIYGIHIDTEWRSDLKWNRVKDHIQPLTHRTVLDVGSGNGYFCWRMTAEGARLVIGIDPFLLNVMQFRMIQSFTEENRIFLLPIGIEEMPEEKRFFDTIFSMGVLYHRRSPLDHLYQLKGLLRAGGELVLETLIIKGKEGEVLVPRGRYGKMRNVWFIPTPDSMLRWLQRCGFKNSRLIDFTPTTTREQRPTDWMRFESLPDFLDKDNPNKTVEGYPAPVRAVFLADAP